MHFEDLYDMGSTLIGSVKSFLSQRLMTFACLLRVEYFAVMVGDSGISANKVLIDSGVRVLAVHCLIIKLLLGYKHIPALKDYLFFTMLKWVDLVSCPAIPC